jgi:hypothetical protein
MFLLLGGKGALASKHQLHNRRHPVDHVPPVFLEG